MHYSQSQIVKKPILLGNLMFFQQSSLQSTNILQSTWFNLSVNQKQANTQVSQISDQNFCPACSSSGTVHYRFKKDFGSGHQKVS